MRLAQLQSVVSMEPIAHQLRWLLVYFLAFTSGANIDINQMSLPVGLNWDSTFKGCKETARAGWWDPGKKGSMCSIYILDMNQLAPSLGVPKCSLANFSTAGHSAMLLMEPRSLGHKIGEPRSTNESKMWPWVTEPHYVAQSGAPWLFMAGLRELTRSRRRKGVLTSDMNSADAVFVDDYCYMLWGLAQQHADFHFLKRNGYEPDVGVINHVLNLWRAITELPRFIRDGGSSFVFWLPHSNTFYDHVLWTSKLHMEYVYFNCFSFRNSLFIVTGSSPRWKCPNYHPERTLLVPASAYQLSNPSFWESMNATLSEGSDREHRTIFMYYRASCLQKPLDQEITDDDVRLFKGRVFRREFVKVLGALAQADIIVECSGRAARPGSKPHISYAEFISMLSHTLFCPVLPGEEQNSLHIVERFVAGCIPVFVGPPYHALPLEKEVWYAISAFFLNITKSYWLSDTYMRWSFPRRRQDLDLAVYKSIFHLQHDGSMQWWFPAGINQGDLISLPTLDDVIPFLRAVPESVILQMLENVILNKSKFIYKWKWRGLPGANAVILDNICHFIGKDCNPR